MGYRVFIIPRRTDLHGMGVQVLDLQPNTSQKNGVTAGEGQTHYVAPGLDFPGATVVNGNAYVSGSRNTQPTAALVAADTTGGGNDVTATVAAEFGIQAYLRERVQPGGMALATAPAMTPANAALQAAALSALLADPANAFSLANVNTVLSTVALGGVANTDLDGTAALSRSFGTVLELLRIFAGEIYRTPQYTIVENVANQFLALAARDVLVAAQVTGTTGLTFVSQGDWLDADESGYQKIPTTAMTDYLLGSLQAGGDLATLKLNMTFNNPEWAYTAADVNQFKLRAVYATAAGFVAVPQSGVAPGLAVIDDLGAKF